MPLSHLVLSQSFCVSDRANVTPTTVRADKLVRRMARPGKVGSRFDERGFSYGASRRIVVDEDEAPQKNREGKQKRRKDPRDCARESVQKREWCHNDSKLCKGLAAIAVEHITR